MARRRAHPTLPALLESLTFLLCQYEAATLVLNRPTLSPLTRICWRHRSVRDPIFWVFVVMFSALGYHWFMEIPN